MSAHMSSYSTFLMAALASVSRDLDNDVRKIARENVTRISNCFIEFLTNPISPASTLEMERQLRELLRQQGQMLMEFSIQGASSLWHRYVPKSHTTISNVGQHIEASLCAS